MNMVNRRPLDRGRLRAVLLSAAFATAGWAACAEEAQPPSAPVSTMAPAQRPGSPAMRPATPEPVPSGAAPAAPAAPASAGASLPVSVNLLPHDLSPWSMFINADIVVKAVMGSLAFASLLTWTIWLSKSLQLWGARRRASRSVRVLFEARSLADVVPGRTDGPLRGGPVAALVHAAEQETARSANLPAEGVKERAAIALGRVEARAARHMTKGTGLIATIGSTAPFVGLFGTVWGIMNAFVGISQAHTTNLAVVAPGIAEALLATAIGLVAAIPAVIIYNQFARSISGYKALLADASAEVMRHLSRDLDRRLHPAE